MITISMNHDRNPHSAITFLASKIVDHGFKWSMSYANSRLCSLHSLHIACSHVVSDQRKSIMNREASVASVQKVQFWTRRARYLYKCNHSPHARVPPFTFTFSSWVERSPSLPQSLVPPDYSNLSVYPSPEWTPPEPSLPSLSGTASQPLASRNRSRLQWWLGYVSAIFVVFLDMWARNLDDSFVSASPFVVGCLRSI